VSKRRRCYLCTKPLVPAEYWQGVCHECAIMLPDDGDHHPENVCAKMRQKPMRRAQGYFRGCPHILLLT
jgi:hypothetical protein